MATEVVAPERVEVRRDTDGGAGDLVVYWMQQAQRSEHNEALEHAARRANALDAPLAVVFCLVDHYPDAGARHYRFMVDGLAEVAADLERRGIAFTMFRGDPNHVFGKLDHRTILLVTDAGYLPIEQLWRNEVEQAISCGFEIVETEVVVPTNEVANELAKTARSIRPKLLDQLDRWVVELSTTALTNRSPGGTDHPIDLARTDGNLEVLDPLDPHATMSKLDFAADDVGPVTDWVGGTAAAKRVLADFLAHGLSDYADGRSRYDGEHSSSRLSPYLHFGQISPVHVARTAMGADARRDGIDAFIEELVVRRELAVNFVIHEPDHASFSGLPSWARETLTEHRDDDRPVVYTAEELECGETHDEVWNTIMKVIREQGWVHNQLRMYWGKQIVQWTNTPEYALRVLLDLNNRHFLDGRDANSYANVAWCFGRHDRAFRERDISGKLRPFTDQALRRKGDLDAWVETHR